MEVDKSGKGTKGSEMDHVKFGSVWKKLKANMMTLPSMQRARQQGTGGGREEFVQCVNEVSQRKEGPSGR